MRLFPLNELLLVAWLRSHATENDFNRKSRNCQTDIRVFMRKICNVAANDFEQSSSCRGCPLSTGASSHSTSGFNSVLLTGCEQVFPAAGVGCPRQKDGMTWNDGFLLISSSSRSLSFKAPAKISTQFKFSALPWSIFRVNHQASGFSSRSFAAPLRFFTANRLGMLAERLFAVTLKKMLRIRFAGKYRRTDGMAETMQPDIQTRRIR